MSVTELLAAAQKEGICIIQPETERVLTEKKDGVKFCTTGTNAITFDPGSIKSISSCKIGFKVTNNDAEAKWFVIGRRGTSPGQDPLYPGDPFVGAMGTDDADFSVALNANPAGPNALGEQQFMEHCPEGLIRSLDIVRVPNNDPILDNDLVKVRYFCNGDQCKRTTITPFCDICGNNNSNFTNIRFNFGLAAYGRRDAIALLIPGKDPEAAAVTYNIQVQLLAVEGAYGYVASC